MFIFRIILYIVLFFIVSGCSKKDDQLEVKNKTSQLNFHLKSLRESLEQKIDDIFDSASSDLVMQVNQLIFQVEPGVRKIINNPSFAEILKGNQVESIVQGGALIIEIALIEKSFGLMEERATLVIEASLHNVNQEVKELDDSVHRLSTHIGRVNVSNITPLKTQAIDLINSFVYDQLRSQYSRRDLGFLEEESLLSDQNSIYVFQSPQSDFLNKIKKTYNDLRISNPYNEQGVSARKCGLQYIKQADQVYADGNEELAEMVYQKAQAIISVTEGKLPNTAKDVYGDCTGKNLFTGRIIDF